MEIFLFSEDNLERLMFIAITVLAGIIWRAQLLLKEDGKRFMDLLRMIQTPQIQESHYFQILHILAQPK